MALPSWISTHKGDAARATFWLVKLGLTTPVYLTDCDQPIFWDSQTFAPFPLDVEGFQTDLGSAAAGGGALSLATGGSWWEALVGEIAGGKRDFEVTIWEAWLDPAAFPSAVPPADAVRLVAVTKVESGEWGGDWIRFTLGPTADPSLARLPGRDYSTICTYRTYKGGQCGYAGSETTCDRLLATCTTRGNEARFGGFPTLPAEEAELQWLYEFPAGNVVNPKVTLLRREK